MKSKVVKELLLKAVSTCAQASANNTVIPYLNNSRIRVNAENQELTIESTDMEVSIAAHLKLVIAEGDLDTAVPTALLESLVKSIPEDIVGLETTSSTLDFIGTRSHSSIRTISPQDFPLLQWSTDPLNAINMPAAELAKAIRTVAISVSRDPVQTGNPISGMLIEAKGGRLTMVGVDGFRYSIASMEVDSEMDASVIVPAKSMNIVNRSIRGEAMLTIGSPQIFFQTQGVYVGCLTLSGTYPDYTKFPKPEPRFILNMSVAELNSALKQLSVLVREDKPFITMKMASDSMFLHIATGESERGKSSVDVLVNKEKVDSAPLDITVNVAYLQDVLSVVDADTVVMHVKDKASPILLQTPEQSGTYHGILPVV